MSLWMRFKFELLLPINRLLPMLELSVCVRQFRQFFSPLQVQVEAHAPTLPNELYSWLPTLWLIPTL